MKRLFREEIVFMGSPVDCELSSRGHSQRFLKVKEGWEMNSFKECTELCGGEG